MRICTFIHRTPLLQCIYKCIYVLCVYAREIDSKYRQRSIIRHHARLFPTKEGELSGRPLREVSIDDHKDHYEHVLA